MPILPAEPCVYPDDLLQTCETIPSAVGEQWWVLHSKPRAEKALARRLRSRFVSHFLPLYQHSWRQRGRNHTSFLPLFPGYVFLYGADDARHLAVESNLIVRALPVADQQQLLTDLSRVYRLLSGNLPLTPENGFRPGVQVEITTGPFEGIRGKLLRNDGKIKLVVEVRFLQQGVSLEVEPWMVRAVNDDGPVEIREPALSGCR